MPSEQNEVLDFKSLNGYSMPVGYISLLLPGLSINRSDRK